MAIEERIDNLNEIQAQDSTAEPVLDGSLDLKTYEIGFLMSPFVPNDAANDTVNAEIVAKIENKGGKIQSRITPEMKKLAYTVVHTVGNNRSKYKEAYFGAIVFDLSGAAAVKLIEELKASEQVIRFVLIVLPKNAPKNIAKPEIAVKRQAVSDKEIPASSEEIDKKIEDLLEVESI